MKSAEELKLVDELQKDEDKVESNIPKAKKEAALGKSEKISVQCY